MQNHTNPAAGSLKLLPFLRPVSPVTTAREETSLSRPVLVPEGGLSRLSRADMLAHDARNALTSLELLAGLLGEPGVLAEPYARYAADLATVTDSLKGLVNRFAGVDSGPALCDGSTERVSARSACDALENCGRLLRTMAGPAVAVHISTESGLPPLSIGDDALMRVLMNLVKNASEAMPDGGAVRITARRALSRTDPAVLIHVSDNGPGIPAYALEQIFDPGWTSKPNSGAQRGLGLAIVRELVEAAGGEVCVASTRRRGTTFELRLPSKPAGRAAPVLP